MASRLAFVFTALWTLAAQGQLRIVTLPRAGDRGAASQFDPRSTAEPYLLRPGHYVLPAPYSPDYWSPHIRPFPDYSVLRQSSTLQNRDFGAYPQAYGGGASPYYSQFTPYGYAPYAEDVGTAYNQGRYDAQHEYLWYIASQRAGRLLNQYSVQFDEAMRMFRDGQYEQALVNFLGAAEANHDSAAPRLHAGHTLFALGRYREAVPLLARAFELSPGLAYKTYDIRDEYGDRSEFSEQFDALKRHVATHPSDTGALTLLGYITYFAQGPGAADRILKAAARRDPKSYFIPKLLQVSSRAAPAHAPSNRAAKPANRQAAPRSSHRPPERQLAELPPVQR